MRTPIVALRNVRATRGQHAGLLLQRYLCENATGEGGNPEEKRAILQAAIKAAGDPEVRELYKAAYFRWRDELDRKELTAADDLQTPEKSRLIIGLGTENVLETGIRLHHTYGMPILPGSALKGLAAHYCDEVWGSSEESFKKGGIYHKLLFGTTDESGCIVFHDAWFTPDSENEPLKLDVMTPHHPKWIDGSVPPTDFDSPNPVQFISVAGTFNVAVSWRGPDADESAAAAWLERALECLRDALFHWGIGGKTSSGYGRFDRDAYERAYEAKRREERAREEEAKKQAELAQMPPLEREIREFLDQWPDQTSSEYSRLCGELKRPDSRWQDSNARKEVARMAKEMMIKEKKWGKKGKDAERTKMLKELLGES